MKIVKDNAKFEFTGHFYR